MIAMNLRRRLLLLGLVPSAILAIVLVACFTFCRIKALDAELRERGGGGPLSGASERIRRHFRQPGDLQNLAQTTGSNPASRPPSLSTGLAEPWR